MQARAIALYHLDCPWRPSDIAQREGRILRQGNQNKEIAIVRVVTERSFDSYMWQGVERKAKFISQIMRGRLDVREIEEIDSASLTAAEAKAISSGNPLLLDQATLQSEVARLRRLERAHANNERMLQHTRTQAGVDAAGATADIAGLQAAIPKMFDTSGDRFGITLNSRFFDSRSDAGHALMSWARQANMQYASRHLEHDYGVIGRIGGFDISCSLVPEMAGDVLVRTRLEGVPRGSFAVTRDTFLSGGLGLIQRIENRMAALPKLLEEAESDLARAEQLITDAEQRLGQPFKHALALSAAEADLEHVEKKILAMQREKSEDKTPAPPAPVSRPELTVEAVRGYQPMGGARSDLGEPAPLGTAPAPARSQGLQLGR